MSKLTRRSFIGKATMAAGTAALACQNPLQLMANPLDIPIGFQVYPIREMLVKDFKGTLRKMAALGYQTVEMCSPPGYVDTGFGPLAKLKATEMRKIIESAGLKCESCHYSFQELQKNLDERLAYAKELGLTQMIASGFWLKEDAKLPDWIKAADELNKMGEKTKKAGIQLGFHNHHFEFKQLEGVLIYDALMGKLEPDLIKMQFQVAVINIGFEASAFFMKYPGRFISLHLSDWSTKDKKTVPIGEGVVDWKMLFTAAKLAGVKNYFVEMDLPTLKPSAAYLKELSV